MKKIPHWLLTLEMFLLYLALPVVFFYTEFPSLLVMLVVAGALWYVLHKDKRFDNKVFIRWKGLRKHWISVFILFGIASCAALYAAHKMVGDFFLYLPLSNPLVLPFVMILYPLLSVIPQAVVYRAWFFHRYRPLFGSSRSFVAFNAAVFCFGHISLRNYYLLVPAFLLGLLLAWRYRRTQSLLITIVEHTLYGLLLLFSGFGMYLVSALTG